MAKPKSVHKSLAANRRARRARRARENPSSVRARANPPIGQDFTHVLLPGFGAYAATRVLARIVYNFVQPRWPSLGKHAHALAGVLGFGGTWFFAHKIEKLAPYHDGIVMGSGIAALQGVATAYLPDKYNWLLQDVSPEDVTAPAPAPTTQPAAAAGDEYSYLEDQTESRRARRKRRRQQQLQSTQAEDPGNPPTQPDQNDDLMSILNDGETPDDLYSGSFSN